MEGITATLTGRNAFKSPERAIVPRDTTGGGLATGGTTGPDTGAQPAAAPSPEAVAAATSPADNLFVQTGDRPDPSEHGLDTPFSAGITDPIDAAFFGEDIPPPRGRDDDLPAVPAPTDDLPAIPGVQPPAGGAPALPGAAAPAVGALTPTASPGNAFVATAGPAVGAGLTVAELLASNEQIDIAKAAVKASPVPAPTATMTPPTPTPFADPDKNLFSETQLSPAQAQAMVPGMAAGPPGQGTAIDLTPGPQAAGVLGGPAVAGTFVGPPMAPSALSPRGVSARSAALARANAGNRPLSRSLTPAARSAAIAAAIAPPPPSGLPPPPPLPFNLFGDADLAAAEAETAAMAAEAEALGAIDMGFESDDGGISPTGGDIEGTPFDKGGIIPGKKGERRVIRALGGEAIVSTKGVEAIGPKILRAADLAAQSGASRKRVIQILTARP